MKGLNFSGWQKIASDKKSTTLRHDKGHMMTLAHNSLPKVQQEALKRIKFYDDGGDVKAGDNSQTPAQAPVTVNVGAAPQSPQMPVPQQNASPQVQVPNVPNAPSPVNPNGTMNPTGTQQLGMAGEKLGSQVQAAQSAAEAPLIQQNLQNQAAQNKYAADIVNQLQNKTNDFASFHSQNPLKENAYLENMGAGRKMGTALGLLFSGAGSGLSGQPNLAYDFLNKQIDRNIDAQKNRFDQAKTVWGAYNTLYGNQQVADNLARVHQLDYLNMQGKQIAAQLGTPQAAAALMKLQAETVPQRSKLIQDSAVQLSDLPGYTSQPQGGGAPSGIPGQAKAVNPNQKLIDAGIVAGTPSKGIGQEANASLPPDQAKDNYYESHILDPNAVDKINKLKWGTKQDRSEYNDAKTEYANALQMEKNVKQIDELFPKLRDEATWSGTVGRNVSPHALAGLGSLAGGALGGAAAAGLVPVTAGMSALGTPALVGGGATAGGAAGEGLGRLLEPVTKITGGESEANYQVDKAGLTKFLVQALPNAPLSIIEDIVEKNTPTAYDRSHPATYQKKISNLKKFMLSSPKTPTLINHNIVKKP